jgi:hypothetical protein
MRTIRSTLVLLAVAIAVLLAGQLVNIAPTSAAPATLPLEVEEQNLDLAGRIQVSLPNVDEDGRLLVVPPDPDQPEAYQAVVQGVNQADVIECRDLPVPAGQRLELRFVSMEMEAVHHQFHLDYVTGLLRVRHEADPFYVRDVTIPMTVNGIPYEPDQGFYWKEGFTDVLAFKAASDPQTKLQLCVYNNSGGLIDVSFSGIATGWLHDE